MLDIKVEELRYYVGLLTQSHGTLTCICLLRVFNEHNGLSEVSIILKSRCLALLTNCKNPPSGEIFLHKIYQSRILSGLSM